MMSGSKASGMQPQDTAADEKRMKAHTIQTSPKKKEQKYEEEMPADAGAKREQAAAKSARNPPRPHKIVSPPTAKKQRLELLPLCQEEMDEIITLTVHDDVGIRCHIEILKQQTLEHLARILCEEVLPTMREDDDGGCGMDEHLWHFELGTASGSDRILSTLQMPGRVKWSRRQYSGPDHYQYEDDFLTCEKRKTASSPLSSLQLSDASGASWLRFTYDMGTTTEVLLSVDTVIEMTADPSLFPRLIRDKIAALFPIGLESDEGCRLIKSVPAHSVPLHEQVDAAFPRLAKAMLSQNYECVTLGLSNIFSENSANFFSMKHKGPHQGDFFFAPIPFASLEELFLVAESAFSPDDTLSCFRDAADKCAEARMKYAEDCKERVRACRCYSGVTGLYTKSGDTGDDGTRFHCLAADAADAADAGQAIPSVVAPSQAPPSPLSLSLLFPRTCKQLASGLFRWIRYRSSSKTLEVIVGRGVGEHRRKPETKNVCQTVQGPFASLHHMLCAVEASWISPVNGSPLKGPMVHIDDDAGEPSDPVPPEPTVLCRAGDAKCLRASRRQTGKSCFEDQYVSGIGIGVTALAFAGESELLVGLCDGHIEKWSVADAHVGGKPTQPIFRISALIDDDEESHIAVMGLGVVMDANPPCFYSWARESGIGLWDLRTGELLSKLDARLGLRSEPNWPPCVNCVVPLRRPGEPLILLAGLHMYPFISSSTFDEDEEDGEVVEGNIMPFDTSTSEALETWAGHSDPTVALAVVSGKYVVSVGALQPPNILVDMKMWDLSGRLLCLLAQWTVPAIWRGYLKDSAKAERLVRAYPADIKAATAARIGKSFWKTRTWAQKLQEIEATAERDTCNNQTRSLSGISVFGNTICLMTDYGTRLLLFDLHTRKALGTIKPSITHGYDDECLSDSSMGMCGNFLVAANANSNQSLLMDLTHLKNFPHLIPPGDKEECGSSCSCGDRERRSSPNTTEGGSRGRARSWYHRMAARGIVQLPRADELPRAGDGLNSDSKYSWTEREEPFACRVALASGLVAAGYRNGAVVLQSVKSSVEMNPVSNAGLVSCLSVELEEAPCEFPDSGSEESDFEEEEEYGEEESEEEESEEEESEDYGSDSSSVSED